MNDDPHPAKSLPAVFTLEPRILMSGTWIDVDAAEEAEQEDESKTEGLLECENAGGSEQDLFGNDLLFERDDDGQDEVADESANGDALPHESDPVDQASGTIDVALVDVTLENGDLLAESFAEDVVIVEFNSELESTSEIIARVNDVGMSSGQQIESLTILSHGSAGEIHMGIDSVSADAFDDQAWSSLDESMADGGNIYIFGCEVAADGSGDALLDRIADATNADVFASDDVTGAGGDWELESASTNSEQELANGIEMTFDESAIGSYQYSLGQQTLYLVGDGEPVASMSESVSSDQTLDNFDADRDAEPGLLIQKGGEGAGETDSVKSQTWIYSSNGMELDGDASFTIWSAMKDFSLDKGGTVDVFLVDTDLSGGDVKVIASSQFSLDAADASDSEPDSRRERGEWEGRERGRSDWGRERGERDHDDRDDDDRDGRERGERGRGDWGRERGERDHDDRDDDDRDGRERGERGRGDWGRERGERDHDDRDYDDRDGRERGERGRGDWGRERGERDHDDRDRDDDDRDGRERGERGRSDWGRERGQRDHDDRDRDDDDRDGRERGERGRSDWGRERGERDHDRDDDDRDGRERGERGRSDWGRERGERDHDRDDDDRDGRERGERGRGDWGRERGERDHDDRDDDDRDGRERGERGRGDWGRERGERDPDRDDDDRDGRERGERGRSDWGRERGERDHDDRDDDDRDGRERGERGRSDWGRERGERDHDDRDDDDRDGRERGERGRSDWGRERGERDHDDRDDDDRDGRERGERGRSDWGRERGERDHDDRNGRERGERSRSDRGHGDSDDADTDGDPWQRKTVDFGDVEYSVDSGRAIGIKIVVNASSDDDMWFAFDTNEFSANFSFTTAEEVAESPVDESGSGTSTPENQSPSDLTLVSESINENAANGTIVGSVSASDPDGGESFSYAMTDSAGGRFAVDADSGAITVADGSKLNFEDASSHEITVEVTDSVGNTYEESFTIDVADVNEVPSDLSLTGNSVAENAADGTVVGSVAASDPDGGESFSYSMTDSAGGRFAVDADSGAITVADGAKLNFEDASSHEITVEVTDSAGNTYEESFTIDVADVNEGPSDLSLTGNSVAENAADGTVVGSVAASDPDGGESFSYSMTDSAGGRFAVDADSGAISVADGSKLNFEDASSHEITVEVTDSVGNTYEESFTIDVADVNEGPSDLTLTGNSIDENAADGTVVGSVAASDPDGGESFSYSMTDSAGGRFAVDADSGAISVADGSKLNFEDASSHEITVEVTDSAGNTYEESFTIDVADVNEGPSDLSLTGNSIDENAADGTVVGSVSASDPDGGESFSYSMTDSAGGRFAVDADSGAITVADGSKLNFEDASSHEITVEVTDSAGNTYEESFTIDVADVNEGPSDLTLTGNSVAENAADKTIVGSVSASDPDGGESFSYSMTDSAGGRFAVDADSGAITVADGSKLNFEDASSHEITVEVTDSAGNTYEENFTIDVADVNEGPSDLALTGDSVAENAADGTVVGSVSASDPDGGESFSYSMTDSAGGRFAVDADSGAITVADGSKLNLEDASSHEITVEVTDSDGNTYEESFTIDVADVNEGPTESGRVISWSGEGGNGDWTDSSNWSSSEPPGPGDVLLIDADAPRNLVLGSPGQSFTVQSIVIEGDYKSTINLAGDVQVLGDLIVEGGQIDLGDSRLSIGGNLNLSEGVDVDFRGGQIVFDGEGDQSLSANDTVHFGDLRIEKASGELTLDVNMRVSGDFALVGGGFDANGHTVEFQGSNTTINAAGGSFGDVTLNVSGTTTFTHDMAVEDITIIAASRIDGGAVHVSGDVTTNDSGWSGSATFVLDGAEDQTITTDGSGELHDVTIDKASGKVTLENDLQVSGDFVVANGEFDQNGKLLEFQGSNTTIDAEGVSFGDVTLNVSGTTTITHDIAVDDITIIAASRIDGGLVHISGDVTTNDSGWSGSATFVMDGAGDQTITTDGSGELHDVTIDKASGKVTLENDLQVSGDFVVANGEFDQNGKLLEFQGSNTTIDAEGVSFGDVTLNVSGTTTFTHDIAVDDITIIAASRIDGGAVHISGDVTTNDSGWSGSATFVLDGAEDQTITTDGSGELHDVTIDKASGKVTLENDLQVSGDFTVANGEFDQNGKLLEFQGSNTTIDAEGVSFGDVTLNVSGTTTFTHDIAVDDITIIAASRIDGGAVHISGDVTTNDSGWYGSATFVLDGTEDQTITTDGSGELHDVTIEKASGKVTLENDLQVSGDFVVANGEFDQNGKLLEFQGSNTTIDAEGVSFGDVTLNVSGTTAITHDMAVEDITIIAASRIDGGAVHISGDVTTNDSGWSGSATFVLDGPGNQAIVTDGSGELHDVVIQKSSGTVSLENDLQVSGDFELLRGHLEQNGHSLEFQGSNTSIATGNTVLTDVVFNTSGTTTIVNRIIVDGDVTVKSLSRLEGANVYVLGELTLEDASWSGGAEIINGPPNDPPVGVSLSNNRIDENAARGTIVGTASARDPDVGDTLTFELTDNADGRFAIESETGKISVADESKLNFEDASSHQVVIKVTDSVGNVYHETLAIHVDNVNESPSGFALAGGTVSENAVNGTVVGSVSANDPDSDETFVYRLLDSADGRFAVDEETGVITVADESRLDFENAANHRILVEVVDSAGNRVQRSVTIGLVDLEEPVASPEQANEVQSGSERQEVSESELVRVVHGDSSDPDGIDQMHRASPDKEQMVGDEEEKVVASDVDGKSDDVASPVHVPQERSSTVTPTSSTPIPVADFSLPENPTHTDWENFDFDDLVEIQSDLSKSVREVDSIEIGEGADENGDSDLEVESDSSLLAQLWGMLRTFAGTRSGGISDLWGSKAGRR